MDINIFITEHEITSDASLIGTLNDGGTEWRVTLTVADRTMVLTFTMGPALTGEPSTADVLDCLACDCAGYENANGFEEWADEYGYDTDSREAEATYNAIRAQVIELDTLLGPDAYNTLLWNTERL
jgi:hypothetical protein